MEVFLTGIPCNILETGTFTFSGKFAHQAIFHQPFKITVYGCFAYWFPFMAEIFCCIFYGNMAVTVGHKIIQDALALFEQLTGEMEELLS